MILYPKQVGQLVVLHWLSFIIFLNLLSSNFLRSCEVEKHAKARWYLQLWQDMLLENQSLWCNYPQNQHVKSNSSETNLTTKYFLHFPGWFMVLRSPQLVKRIDNRSKKCHDLAKTPQQFTSMGVLYTTTKQYRTLLKPTHFTISSAIFVLNSFTVVWKKHIESSFRVSSHVHGQKKR